MIRLLRRALSLLHWAFVAALFALSISSLIAYLCKAPSYAPPFLHLGSYRWLGSPVAFSISHESRSLGGRLILRGKWTDLQDDEKEALNSKEGGYILRRNFFESGAPTYLWCRFASYSHQSGYHVIPANLTGASDDSWDLRDGQWLRRTETSYDADAQAWIIAALFSLYPIWYFSYSSKRRIKKRRRRGSCVKCGYNLTGNVTGVCPECGAAIPTLVRGLK